MNRPDTGTGGSGGAPYAPLSPPVAGLLCRCPRCGSGALFPGILTVAEHCPVCRLDLSKQDAGDGPAVFVILILGAIVTALAFWVEFRFEPPIWVHVILWFPLTIGGAIWMLRVIKAWLIAEQFRHRDLGAERR